LPPELHAFALTQRGHGDAARPSNGYRTRNFARDLADLVENLNQGPVIVVGHSMGSTNALRFAIDFPQLTRGLVLLGSLATYRDNPVIKELWQLVSELKDPIDPAFAREFQQSTLARPVASAFVDMVVQESLKVPARVWRAALEGLMEDDFTAELNQINVPTLLLWGERDAFCPRGDQDRQLDAIAGSQLAVYAGAGHALHWEEPARVAGDLIAFVRASESARAVSRYAP